MEDVYYVPEYIIHNILARLPIKPLLRFKCVSKQWNRLISHPYFMKSRARRMILISEQTFVAIDNKVPGDDVANSVIKLRFPSKHMAGKTFFPIGTFNGIVLLLVVRARPLCDDMILWNPCTGAVKEILRPPYRKWDSYSYGFGYDSTSYDLKIVRLAVTYHEIVYFDVFSLKNMSWSTPMELTGRFSRIQNPGKFVNGFLYWIAGGEKRVILALDVKEMVFSEIQLKCGSAAILGTFKGSLCMILFQCDGVGYELWVMNEHSFEFEKSWSKVCSLTFLSYYNFPKCILNEGKVLWMNDTNKLIIHDVMKNPCKEFTLPHDAMFLSSQVIEYVESLVSPSDLLSSLI